MNSPAGNVVDGAARMLPQASMTFEAAERIPIP
jgi:hypothetical protein